MSRAAAVIDNELDLFTWADVAKVVRETVEPPAKPKPLAEPIAPPALGLATLKRPLRDYQDEARQKVHTTFVDSDRALVVAATGAGKTVLFAAIAADFQPGRVLILTDQEELVDQAIEKILEFTGIYADAEQAERKASLNAKVIAATVQTMRARLAKYPPDWFKLIVCDECDRAVAKQWKTVLNHFDGHAKVLGVTATPKRTDKRNILEYFKTKCFEIDTLELIGRGSLAPIMVQTVPLEIDLSDVPEEMGDYDREATAKAVERVFAAVCTALKKHAPTRKILAFLPLVDTSKKFVSVCLDNGINARHVDGTSRDRDELKRGFREKRFQLLSNPMLLGRGYDDPSIDCIVNLRPTKSESLYRQIVGRGTRIYCPHGCRSMCEHEDRKKDLLVLDFLYQFKGMGPVRPSSLIADTAKKGDMMTEISKRSQIPLDLRDLEKKAVEEMEAALLRAIGDAQRKAKGAKARKGEYYNAFQWAANLHITELIEYEPENEAEAAPIPKKLLRELANAGFVVESVTCRGHAERIFEVIKARRDAGLASFRQVHWLRKFGYQDAVDYTREAAEKVLTREFADRQRHGHRRQPGASRHFPDERPHYTAESSPFDS